MRRYLDQSKRNIYERHKGKILIYLCRHVAALTWLDQSINRITDEGPLGTQYDVQPNFVSGFFVECSGVAFFVTAGHILTGIARAEAVGRSIIKTEFFSGFHKDTKPDFTLLPKSHFHRLWLYEEETGLDVGVIPIDDHFSRLLRLVDVHFVDEHAWATDTDEFDAYVMLGFPKQESKALSRHIYGGGLASFSIGTPLLLLARIDEPPPGVVKGPHRFYAQIDSLTSKDGDRIFTLDDIDGMSGGPIFGIRISNDSLTYKLVAVQGAWHAPTKIIAASEVRPFVTLLAEKFKADLVKYAEQQSISANES